MDFQAELNHLKRNGLHRKTSILSSAQGPRVTCDGRTLLLLGSNNYLGLNTHPKITAAALEATRLYGTGTSGSRLTTGTLPLHEQLEKRIASFKGTEDALLFSTGYMANVGILSALCDHRWTIVSDKRNHASILDGAKLSGAKLLRYAHRDMVDLEKKLTKVSTPHCLIVTDGVFSMDGTIAPLQEICRLGASHDALVMVDDAHGIGVLGQRGSGTAEHLGVTQQVDLHMGTLSKAVPAAGGYVAGKRALIDYLRNHARSFIYSTAPPPSVIGASLHALDIIEHTPALRRELMRNQDLMCRGLTNAGFTILETETPIIAVLIGDPERAIAFSKRLMDADIYAPAIRPPTVPKGTSRLRLSVCADHTETELLGAIKTMTTIAKELDIL